MKRTSIFAALLAIFLALSAPVTDANGQMADRKPKDVVQERAKDVADRAEAERDQVKRRDKKNEDRVNEVVHDDVADLHDDDSDYGDAGDRAADGRDHATKGLDNAASRGNEKSQEMRARRDERKAIKQEYKADGKGAATDIHDADLLPTDVDEDAKGTEKKETKPWWKFWGQ